MPDATAPALYWPLNSWRLAGPAPIIRTMAKPSSSVSIETRPATAITINFGDPGQADTAAGLPHDGAGPCPTEQIIRDAIGVHPMALLFPALVTDADERGALDRLAETHGGDGVAYFVDTLAGGMAAYARPFALKSVVVRLSDFQSDEYTALLGGRYFEPVEENPLVAFRGAVRYVHADYAPAFALECAAMVKARDEFGFTNLQPMVPYCRRAGEAQRVLDAMAANGLRRGDNGLKIHLMAEVPNNAAEIDTLAQMFDGISIGIRDFTQSVLGIDAAAAFVRDEDVDPCDPGVQHFMRMIIDGAKRHNCPVSICGPAASGRLDLLEFVLRCGIDAISLRLESVVRMTQEILRIESRIAEEGR